MQQIGQEMSKRVGRLETLRKKVVRGEWSVIFNENIIKTVILIGL